MRSFGHVYTITTKKKDKNVVALYLYEDTDYKVSVLMTMGRDAVSSNTIDIIINSAKVALHTKGSY